VTSYDYDSPVSESGELTKIRFSKTNGDGTQGPGFCRSQFVLREVGDTFLDTRGWGKGVDQWACVGTLLESRAAADSV
jgi:hypothetical protein